MFGNRVIQMGWFPCDYRVSTHTKIHPAEISTVEWWLVTFNFVPCRCNSIWAVSALVSLYLRLWYCFWDQHLLFRKVLVASCAAIHTFPFFPICASISSDISHTIVNNELTIIYHYIFENYNDTSNQPFSGWVDRNQPIRTNWSYHVITCLMWCFCVTINQIWDNERNNNM